MKEKTCCFFGHRTINETEQLKAKLVKIIEKLIADEKVDTFLFGSKSQFNSLAHSVYIKRNYEMIEKSQFCIIYRETDCFSRKSGTDIAYKYAKKKNIIIKNVYQQ